MTELLFEKLELYKSKTGTQGIIFLFLVTLFFISIISDVIYGSSTTASSLIKAGLVLAIGISFVSIATGGSAKRQAGSFSKRKTIKKVKRRSSQAVVKSVEQVTAQPGHNLVLPIIAVKEEESVTAQPTQQEVVEPVQTPTSILALIRKDLQESKNQERATKQREFFATKEGGETRKNRSYLGVNIADIVKISSAHAEQVTLDDIQNLVASDIHDERIIAIWLLINSYKISSKEKKQAIYDFYLENRTSVDNWDMVDLAARNIIGTHIADNISYKGISDDLIGSDSVWDKRTAVMSAHPLVLAGDLGYGFSVAERLIDCPEELVQSSLGWVLKEAYKQDAQATESFIKSHFQSLSKQAIRIGTERMEKNYRKAFLRGEFEPAQA